MDGTLRGLPEDPRPHLRPGLRVFRTLSVRALRHHLEDLVYGTSVDEAHPASVERRRSSKGRAAYGDRESPCRPTHRAHDDNLCSVVVSRQCRFFLRRWRLRLLSFADSASRYSEHLPRVVFMVEFRFE